MLDPLRLDHDALTRSDAAVYVCAYAEAYETKNDKFRGVAKNKDTGEILRGEERETLAEAKNDCKRFIVKLLKGRAVRQAPIAKKNNWVCNYWADA